MTEPEVQTPQLVLTAKAAQVREDGSERHVIEWISYYHHSGQETWVVHEIYSGVAYPTGFIKESTETVVEREAWLDLYDRCKLVHRNKQLGRWEIDVFLTVHSEVIFGIRFVIN
ncbi:hypothetical protein MCOR25_002688 [Pyricularia grisea]|nr:hypothetical protein MCOR25_002688 [Pyricularia grisea]